MPMPPTFLQDLKMPLRDALRGVASFAEATEEMLEPAANLLPEPIGARLREAMHSLEQAGQSLIHSEIDADQIRAATRFLMAEQTDAATTAQFARVFVYAWEHLERSNTRSLYLISETVIAEQLTTTSGLSGPDFAAMTIRGIWKSPAFGRAPGLARAITQDEETDVGLIMVAIATWLMSARSETVQEEEKVLDLSIALVRAMQDEALTALEDPALLARFLDAVSARL